MMSRFSHSLLTTYRSDKSGGVAIENAILSGFLIIIVGATVELQVAYWQWSAARHATTVGARIAAISDPVSNSVLTMTGLSGEVNSGDPIGPYSITCSGASSTCSSGNMNTSEFERIIFGPNNDGLCEHTDRYSHGMCDVFNQIESN